MFFIVSKLFWAIFAPSHLLLWLTLTTAALLYFRRVRAGQWTAMAAAVLFVVIAVLPTGVWLMRPIENRYARPAWPLHVDGILVLGGAENAVILHSRGVANSDESEARLVAGYELARHYPNARLVYTGGSLRSDGRYALSDVARYVYGQMGLDPRRLILEDKSRNTWENFVYSERLVRPQPGEVWVLVTSASHMPRAMAIAGRVKWTVIPWPSDYQTARHGAEVTFDVASNLRRIDWAVHEWIGLLAYRLTGKAD